MQKRKKKKSPLKKILLILVGILVAILLICGAAFAKIYHDVKGTADNTYETVARTSKKESKREKVLTENRPFSILLLGVDTGDLGRTDQGRSDTMLVGTINPDKKESLLVSLPRDTYTKIIGHNTEDKMNHAYAFGGAAMAMDTVENLLDIPIDHYVTINMKGLQELVDAVDGITVHNDLAFDYDGESFPQGELNLNGEQALKYSRMRYDDPNGDYGRQDRQRQVIEAVAKKGLSTQGISNYQTILTAMGNNAKTDLSFDDMKKIATDYRSAFDTINTDQLQGESFMQDNVSYQKINDNELARIQKELKDQLELK